jgi:hypothetical protein
MQQSASARAIGTLGSGFAGKGDLLTAFGSETAWQALGWVRRLFRCSFALAIADFSAALFVDNLLNFFL